MANEILLNVLGDQTLAEALSTAVLRLRAERTTMLGHPALVYGGRINGTRSNVLKVPTTGLEGYDLPASVADGDSVAYTAWTDRSDQVTVAPYRKAYAPSDLAKMVAGDRLDINAFARDMLQAGASQLVKLNAAAGATFTNTVGSTGVDATIELLDDACAALDAANVEGPYLAILHSTQWNDMVRDVRQTSGGQIQWDPEVANLVKGYGLGYKGRYDRKVDVFVTNHVPTANSGADRAGCVFGVGGLLWGDGVPPVELPPPHQLLVGESILLELARVARAGLTEMVMHQYLGVTRGEDSRGVRILSDA